MGRGERHEDDNSVVMVEDFVFVVATDGANPRARGPRRGAGEDLENSGDRWDVQGAVANSVVVESARRHGVFPELLKCPRGKHHERGGTARSTDLGESSGGFDDFRHR